MSHNENYLHLAHGAFSGDLGLVKAALAAGANVNGSPEQPFPPIVAAAMADRPGMVNFLLDQGADAEKPVTQEVPCPTADIINTTIPGERALHVAARSGKVEIVRLLLKRSRAGVNATDSKGFTPLMATCICEFMFVEVVRLLLEAGADLTLAEGEGNIPLHVVAYCNHMDLVEMVYQGAPAMLNCCPANGETPLYLACAKGHEKMVSKLLLLGARQPRRPNKTGKCPMRAAVIGRFMGVLRVLISEGGIRACGERLLVLPESMYYAVISHQARMLRMLLADDGEEGAEERRPFWANFPVEGRYLLHYGATHGCPAAVGVLLEAGADEAAPDSKGLIPLDVIGVVIGRLGARMERGKEVAVRRMLQRGPAFRARSWAWPSDTEEADAGGSRDGDTAAAAAAAADAVLSSTPGVETPSVTGVRIFRPKEKGGSKFFVRLIGRYCAKE
ncbi:unnamed protein product [Laminaria digitata]